MDVLLAIKPEFSDKILAGEKTYEFRRTAFRDATETDLIYLYASAPIKEIVGLFTSGRTVEGAPAELWELFGDKSGIDHRDRFMRYFEGADTGFAIQVDRTYQFGDPIAPNDVFETFSPPMSFKYLTSNESQVLRQHVPSSFQSQTVETDLTQYESR